MEKFNRFYEIVFQIGTLENIGEFDKVRYTDTVIVRYPLTTNFAIARSVYAQTNTANISIYGLAQETREKLYKDRDDTTNYILMSIYAGYEQFSSEIFRGVVKECQSLKAGYGTEFLTNIEAWDGGLGIYMGENKNTFDKGTNAYTVLKSLCNNMPEIDVGAISPKYKGETLLRPATFSQKTYNELRTLSQGNLFIDSQKIYFLEDDEVIDGNITDYDLTGNLLGTPKRSNGLITIETVFEPRIIVGQRIKLKSKGLPYLDGEYKVLGVFHDGMISGSKCGQMITTIDLFIGTHIFRRIDKE